MVAAIWSSPMQQALAMPARFFGRFFVNHGLLEIVDRPQWYVVPGGSKQYVNAIAQALGSRANTNRRVDRVRRHAGGVEVTTQGGHRYQADHVIMATHSDQALALVDSPNNLECDVLGAIPYHPNRAILHTDSRLLPKRRLARASWNYRLPRGVAANSEALLTYNMNMLQSLDTRETYCVSLNVPDGMLDASKVIAEFEYMHPVFDNTSVAATARWSEINSVDRISYCGAYWRNGFHEDGLYSAIRAVEPLGGTLA